MQTTDFWACSASSVTDRGALRDGPTLAFLSRDPGEHHQVVLVTGRPPGAGYNVVNQISFRLPTLADLKAMHARLRAEAITEFRIVTHGNAWSVYFGDPKGKPRGTLHRHPVAHAPALRRAVRHRGAGRGDP